MKANLIPLLVVGLAITAAFAGPVAADGHVSFAEEVYDGQPGESVPIELTLDEDESIDIEIQAFGADEPLASATVSDDDGDGSVTVIVNTEDGSLEAGEGTTLSNAESDGEPLGVDDYEISAIDGDDVVATSILAIEEQLPVFEVTDVDPEEIPNVDPGAEVTVNVEVTNTGQAAGTTEIPVAIDADGDTLEEIELDAGDSTTVEVTITAPDEDGAYIYGISTADDEGLVTVLVGLDEVPEEDEPESNGADEDDGEDDTGTDDGDTGADDGADTGTDDTGDGDDEEDDSLPGFGVLVALFAALGGAVLLTRR